MTAYRERLLRRWAIATEVALPQTLSDIAVLTRRRAALKRACGRHGLELQDASPEALASVRALNIQLRFAEFTLTQQQRPTPSGEYVRLLLQELSGARPNEVLLRIARDAERRRAILREEHPTGVPDV